MKKKIPPTRSVGRRSVLELGKPVDPNDFTALIAATQEQAVLATAKRPEDPAMLAAAVMLEAASRTQGSPNGWLPEPGMFATLLVQAAHWVEPARKAWLSVTSSNALSRSAISYVDVSDSSKLVFTFEATEAPSRHEAASHAELFAEIVYHGRAAIGFSADLAWLPPDLVTAADHRMVLALPTPAVIAETAARLTGRRPSKDISDEEAARVTPRLLRLAARPEQTGDDYLAKLCDLISRETSTVAPRTKTKTVREAPTLDRLHGMDEAVAWGFTLKDDLAAYVAGTRDWADVDRGLLLSGATGTGKTLFVRALATTCGVPLVTGSYATWIGTRDGHMGDLIRSMRTSFREAKMMAPAILFIDEIDAFHDRATGARHHREWNVQVVNALLAEIDGVEDREGVVIVAACNDPASLDPALVRAGRLDRHIIVKLPDGRALALITREHLADDVTGEALDDVAMLALGCTGADIEKVVRGARRRARNAGRLPEKGDLVAELLGNDMPREAELELVSVHEAGHAVAGHMLGIPIHGVSLRQVGRQRGGVYAKLSDRFMSAADVHKHLVMLLSGRAAEEVILHRVTSAAGGSGGSDLGTATRVAAAAAAEMGLEDDYGLLWTELGDRPHEIRRVFAGDPRLAALVRERLASAYGTALNLMEVHLRAVLALAKQLRERMALGPDEVASILRAAGCRS